MPNKQDSNVVGLRIAEELTYKVLPGTPEWIAYEPNSYSDFGGQIATVARNPINESRQRQKGVTTDLDASGGFNQDWVQKKLRDLLQGFMFANWRVQPTEIVTAVDVDAANPDEYEVADTTGFQIGNIVLGENFTNANNNGIHVVTAIVANVSVEVADGELTAEASPPATAQITVVGFQGAAGDIDVTGPAGGNLGFYSSTVLDFTTLGLVPGAWIYVGGDTGSLAFTTSANNGFHRVFSIAANKLEIDRGTTLVDEASAAETVQIFLPETLKNEATPALIVDRSYQLERTLGDDGGGTQSEYEIGARASQLQFNVAGQDKVTVDLSFVAADEEVRTGAAGVKGGNRPAIVAEEAFNTSSDFSRLKLTRDSDGTALFAFVTEFTLTIDNSLSPNKAVSVLGAFDISKGQFVVSGSITAYFSDTVAKTALRNNEDVSFDFALVKNNAGWVVDVPLITLGDARLNVEQDAPVTLPLTLDAGKDTTFDHTLLLNNFPYLPTAAG